MQKADLVNEKLVEKVDKKINKIEKKKAKSQLKMASDVAQVNQTEINKLNEEANASKHKLRCYLQMTQLQSGCYVSKFG